MASNHPANDLSDLISEYAKSVLLRTPKHIPLDLNSGKITPVRSSTAYFWLTNWLHSVGHTLLKLKEFNVNQFDEELVNISPPLYISTLEQKLVKYVSKSADSPPLDVINMHYSIDLKSEDLSQLDILYKLAKIASRKSYDAMRKATDKSQVDTHLTPIHQTKKGDTLVQYYQASSRVFKRELVFSKSPTLVKRGQLVQTLDPAVESIECLIANVYQLDAIYGDLPGPVQRQLDLEDIIECDLNWRKVALNRKRAIEMELLLANRKKSSRIEQRERTKTDHHMAQEDIQRELDDYLDEESGNRRSARVRAIEHANVEVKETREERLKRRRLEQGQPLPGDVTNLNDKTLGSTKEDYMYDEDEDDDEEEEYEVHHDEDDDEEDLEEGDDDLDLNERPVKKQKPQVLAQGQQFHQYIPPQQPIQFQQPQQFIPPQMQQMQQIQQMQQMQQLQQFQQPLMQQPQDLQQQQQQQQQLNPQMYPLPPQAQFKHYQPPQY